MTVSKYYILIAEGITDCSFLEAVLEKYLGFLPYQNMKELPSLFVEMIGRYPAVSGELQRKDSPMFFYKDAIGVAVKQAGGCTKIPEKICFLTEIVDKLELYDSFGGFLVFCDTDLKTREEIMAEFTKVFQLYGMNFENDHIELDGNPIICKLCIFPGEGAGAIEKLLLECASISYNQLCQDAQEYRDKIMSEDYEKLRKKHWAVNKTVQEFYSDKVQFGAISTVLKPDRPVRFAIKDELIKKKFYDSYMRLTEFRELHDFLKHNLVS